MLNTLGVSALRMYCGGGSKDRPMLSDIVKFAALFLVALIVILYYLDGIFF